MESLQTFDYSGIPIQFEVLNGHVMANATLMFQVNGSRLDHWRVSPITQRYMEAVTRNLGIAEGSLITTRRGGYSQGTWIHEKLILNAARYISVEFELWCDERIAEMMKLSQAQLTPMPDFSNPVAAARAWADQMEQRILLEKQVQVDAPKVLAADILLSSDDCVTVAVFAKTVGTGQNRMFKWLRENDYLIKHGSKINLPYQKWISSGYFSVREVTVGGGEKAKVFPQPMITTKGQVFLTSKYKLA